MRHRRVGGAWRPAVTRLPAHAPGMRIGLFGGSFNPPHAGHRHAALTAMRRLRLDRVWWLVTPGNPLKQSAGVAPLAARLAAAAALARHPRIAVTGLEAAIGTRYTYDTLLWLTRHCPGVHFVWLMGADSLAGFHRWQRWRDIAAMMPLAIVDRPLATYGAAASRAATTLARWRVDESDAPLLASMDAPALVFLHGRGNTLSSTSLRAAGHKLTSS